MKTIISKIILFAENMFFYLGRVVAKSRAHVWFPGRRTILDFSAIIKYPERITMGHDVWIWSDVSIGAYSGIIIGDRVRISHAAFIETASLDIRADQLPYQHVGKPIRIDDGVWIGAYAIILGGVHIGERAIIAAGAVVVKDVPAHSIVAATAARTIGSRAPKHASPVGELSDRDELDG